MRFHCVRLNAYYLRRLPFLQVLGCPAGNDPSSETQGKLVGAGKRLNGRGKKSREEKSRKKVGAPGILPLTDQFRNHLKSLMPGSQKFSLYFYENLSRHLLTVASTFSPKQCLKSLECSKQVPGVFTQSK